VTQEDLSQADHRLKNISYGKFFRAYAELHQVINDPRWADKPVSDLRVVCEVMNAQLAQMFDFTPSHLVKVLAAVTDPEHVFKTGSGRAE
jgi:hypothetical protein